ncbi:50S ribosome-binding GTPase [Candidatus Micrarchaeota archaeon]|nr:50S ribosome-binding GTPase [Candidatus Micrarchaeota archaeon]
MFNKIINWFRELFHSKKNISLGFYGSPNAGKTSLANRISMDLTGSPLGQVSVIPHETRIVQKKEQVSIKLKNCTLNMNLLDMPGLAVKVDYRDFLNYGLSIGDAQERAKEATKGIVEALKWLDKVDSALVILDSTKEPLNQVNITLLGNLEARGIPIILVANKMDLENANSNEIKKTFPDYPIVEVSALTGHNMHNLYQTIVAEAKTR